MPAPTAPHPMSHYEARKASFFQKETAGGPSRKKTGNAKVVVWPHPIKARKNGSTNKGSSSDVGSDNNNESEYPSPRSMASLGLYHDPTAEEVDRCSIYPDGQAVSDWKEGQSALDRLTELDSTISWVMIERSKRAGEEKRNGEDDDEEKVVWNREEEGLLPTGKAMADARLRTFGGAWPLDGKKGWKPTSKKLSSAGFHFCPNEDEVDCVMCAYCQCSLGGWEKADDPVKEHQKRRPGCLIFNCVLEKKQGAASRVASASSSTTKERSTSRKRGAETMDGEGEQEASSSRSRKRRSPSPQAEEVKASSTTKPVSRSKPTAKKTAGKTKKPSKKAAVAVGEEGEGEFDQQAAKKAMRGKKTKGPGKEAKKKEGGKGDGMEEDEQVVEASDFENEPSRSHSSHSSHKMDRLDSPPTSCESETFKTPKQAVSARTSAKTPKASSPSLKAKDKSAVQGDVAPLKKLEALSSYGPGLTVEEWLRIHVGKACVEMEAEGIGRIAKLKEEMNRGRSEVERILRGTKVSQTG